MSWLYLIALRRQDAKQNKNIHIKCNVVFCYMEYVTGASFETKTRRGFIKVCHILAKGLTFSIDRPLVISIGGQVRRWLPMHF